MKKVLYLTYNDYPSGIYSGQVIDVCRFWKEALQLDVMLVAFISIRGFKAIKQKIVQQFPGAIVLPMFPKASNWKLNRFMLRRWIKKINPQVIVARGPFATLLALHSKGERKICFDARGAYTAELREYNVVPDEKLKAEIFDLEKQAVLGADFRIAVSEQLVQYWKRSFGYASQNHVVIPCTLNAQTFSEGNRASQSPVKENKVTLVYSGGSADWQSFGALDDAMHQLLSAQKELEVILLAKDLPAMKILADFDEHVKTMWLKPEEVKAVLDACDYGWLVREKSVTNAVASPVKFAEYLASGLKVIISEELGDYSEFVKQHDAGIILSSTLHQALQKVTADEKARMKTLAMNHFMKENYLDHYKKLLQ